MTPDRWFNTTIAYVGVYVFYMTFITTTEWYRGLGIEARVTVWVVSAVAWPIGVLWLMVRHAPRGLYRAAWGIAWFARAIGVGMRDLVIGRR